MPRPRWFARPTFSLLTGEPALYRRYADGMVIEGGHLLLRRRHILRSFRGRIFVIDPRTPAFQGAPEKALNPRTERIRASYLRLASVHGGPLWRRFSHLKPANPRDYTRKRCRETAQRLIEFEISAAPKRLMPAYFAFTHMQDAWITVNALMYESFCELVDESSLLLPLAFDHSLLGNPDELDLLCNQLSGIHPAGFAIWPVGLDESHATCQELLALGSLLRRLPDSFLMYGGFLSMLFCTLTGSDYSSGPCFFDRREIDIAPPLEFRPKCRYYVSAIHQKLDPIAAAVLCSVLARLRATFSLCPTCERYVDGGDYGKIAEMATIDLLEHNFASRRLEMDSLASSLDPRQDVIANLEWLLDHKVELSQFRSLKYIQVWLETLRSMAS